MPKSPTSQESMIATLYSTISQVTQMSSISFNRNSDLLLNKVLSQKLNRTYLYLFSTKIRKERQLLIVH